jgi:hypothetical protein
LTVSDSAQQQSTVSFQSTSSAQSHFEAGYVAGIASAELQRLEDAIRRDAVFAQLSEEQRQRVLLAAPILKDDRAMREDLAAEARRHTMLMLRNHIVHRMSSHVLPERAKPVRLARPPRLAFAGLARLVLRAAAYKRYVEPAVADMHEEYFACLKRGDEGGAKIAVIKGNLYAVPGWAWALLAQLVLKLIGWIRA